MYRENLKDNEGLQSFWPKVPDHPCVTQFEASVKRLYKSKKTDVSHVYS